MKNTEELNSYIAELMNRKRVKPCRNEKAYDRAKDRKDKKLYEYEVNEENNCETEQDA